MLKATAGGGGKGMRLVWKEEDLHKNTYELERGALSKGIYFLEIKTKESKWIKRIAVQ